MRMKTLIIISALSLLGASAYYNFFITLWFVAGALWGLINLYFIQQLLYGLLIAKPKKFFRIAMLALIKFPVLYGAGFGLLYYQSEFAWALLAGFSGVLVLSMNTRFWKVFQPLEKKVMMT